MKKNKQGEMNLKKLFIYHKKNRFFKPKIMKKTIELLYTPSKKQPIKQKIMARLMKEAMKALYDSKIKNEKKIKKIKSPKKRRRIL